jgi:hypothetical protein
MSVSLEEKITINLAGLNLLSRCSWSPSRTSVQAWSMGMMNYLQWFKDNHVDVYQDPIDDIWKLGERPNYSKAQLRAKKMGPC